MTIQNGYCTLADYLAFITPRGQTIPPNAPEEAVVERLIAGISRYFDDKTGHTFYPWVQVRWFDTPNRNNLDLRNLRMDADLLEILSITNGNGQNVPSTECYTIPPNDFPITDIHLKDLSVYQWWPDAAGNTHDVIQVNGIWGSRKRYDQRGWYQVGTLSAAMTDTTTPSFQTTSFAPVTSQIFRIDNEILITASYSSPTCTVMRRGDNGSTAATHLISAPIYLWQPEESINLAVLETCNNLVSSRFGQSSAGRITFTQAGIVIRPDDISAFGQVFIDGYQSDVMTIGWNAVATSFAALSPIGAITVKDLSGIPQDCRNLCPILFPWPNGFVKAIKPERLTLALGSVNYKLQYQMTWVYLHAPISAGYVNYASYASNMDALYLALLTNADLITGARTLQFPDLPAIGPTHDPAGNTFQGCNLTFGVFTEI